MKRRNFLAWCGGALVAAREAFVGNHRHRSSIVFPIPHGKDVTIEVNGGTIQGKYEALYMDETLHDSMVRITIRLRVDDCHWSKNRQRQRRRRKP